MSNCDLYFSNYLKNDPSSKYWVYFTNINGNLFGSSNAILLNDSSGVPVTGYVSGQTQITFDFDYSGNTQGGRLPNTDVDITVVSIGLYMGRYTYVSGTLTSGDTSFLLSPDRDWVMSGGTSGGTSGTNGTSGIDGTSGSSGINGLNGTSGSSGINGLNGTSGSSGTNGTSGSSGTNGTSGTSYETTRIEVSDSDYYISGNINQTICYLSITARRVIYLPKSIINGQEIIIRDESGNVSSTNRLIVMSDGVDKIHSDNYNIQITPYNSVKYTSNGVGLWSVSHRNPRLSNGCILTPSFLDNNNGMVTIGDNGLFNLSKNSDGSGLIRTFEVSGGTFDMVDLSTNYVVVDYNNNSPIMKVVTDVSLINETTIIPLFTIYRGGSRLHVVDWDHLGLGLTNKIHQSIVKTQRFRLEKGLHLNENVDRIVEISDGIVWIGANSFSLQNFSSDINQLFFLYRTGNTINDWIFSGITNQYNNTQYNDDSGVHNLNSNRYAVNFIYRGIEIQNEAYMILGQGNYTLSEAKLSLPPSILPQLISSHAILVGRIIVEKNSNISTQIDTVFSPSFNSSASDGTSGTSGTSGSSGVDGTSGINGINGTSGSSGVDGTSGSSGVDGTSGSSGVNGTSGSSGLDGTSGANGTSGSSGLDGKDGSMGYVSVTYLELVELIQNSGLTDGQKYIISDFQTIYDQPDFDSLGLPKSTIITITGNVEQLIVQAISTNNISDDAYSHVYYTDKIKYDWKFNKTEINNSDAKGRIIQRIDNNNNKTPFDNRNIKFKRYEDSVGSGNFTIINDNGGTSYDVSVFGSNCYDISTDNVFDNNYNFLLQNITFGDNCKSINIGTNFINSSVGDNCSSITIGSNVENLIFISGNTNWSISDNINFYDKIIPLVSSGLTQYSKFITKSDSNIIFKYIDGFGDTVIVDTWNNSGLDPIPFGPLAQEVFNPNNKILLSGITQEQVQNWDYSYNNIPNSAQTSNWNSGYTHTQNTTIHITESERNLWNSNGYACVDENSTGGIITLARNTVTNLTNIWDNTMSFEIQLEMPTAGYVNEYTFFFQTGLSVPGVILTPPNGSIFYYPSGLELLPLANKVYMVSIFKRSDAMYIVTYQ